MAKPQKRGGGWRIQWLDSDGTRRSETFATYDLARSALRRRELDVEEIRAGRARPRSDQTIAEASIEWLANRKSAPGASPDVKRRRDNRVRDNRKHLDQHILPALGPMRLPEINDDVIKRFLRDLEGKRTRRKGEKNDGEVGRTLKPATIQNVIVTLRKMLNDLGYPTRIAYTVPRSGYGWIKNPADVARFLDGCAMTWFRMAAEIAVYAGLRQGEVAGLRYDRVDFDRGFILVDRSYDGPTKSKHIRHVALAPELAASLKRWRLATGAAGKGLVVTVPDAEGKHEPIAPDEASMSRRTRSACKRAGVEAVTFHQLRHTYASHLAERVSLPVLGAMLGHANPATTARYAHIDTASLARDPRLHLSFAAPAGEVVKLEPPAPAMHQAGSTPAGSGSK